MIWVYRKNDERKVCDQSEKRQVESENFDNIKQISKVCC